METIGKMLMVGFVVACTFLVSACQRQSELVGKWQSTVEIGPIIEPYKHVVTEALLKEIKESSCVGYPWISGFEFTPEGRVIAYEHYRPSIENGGNPKSGTYEVESDRLFIRCSSMSELTYTFAVSGDKLTLTTPGKKPCEFKKVTFDPAKYQH